LDTANQRRAGVIVDGGELAIVAEPVGADLLERRAIRIGCVDAGIPLRPLFFGDIDPLVEVVKIVIVRKNRSIRSHELVDADRLSRRTNGTELESG
jgi:hypothetical protein